MGFKPSTSTNWAMKPRWKQVKCEFNLYPLYEESDLLPTRLHSSVGRASHRYRGGAHEFESRWSLYSLSAVYIYDLYDIHIIIQALLGELIVEHTLIPARDHLWISPYCTVYDCSKFERSLHLITDDHRRFREEVHLLVLSEIYAILQ